MKCPYCGHEFKEYITFCTNCNTKIKREDYLNSIINEFNEQYDNITHSNYESREIYYENITTEDVMQYSEEYINNEISPEEFTIHYYKQKGFTAFFAENDYWFLLFLLIYYENTLWDYNFFLTLNFGRTTDYEPELKNTNKKDYDNLTKININYLVTTYFDRLNSIYEFNKVNEIFNNGKTIYHNYTPYNLFSIDNLISTINHLKVDQLKLIFERMGQDLKYYSYGFPDLIVYNNEEFFLVEVKSKNDDFSFKQIQWLKFLSDIVKIKVVILTINKTEKQIEHIKKEFENSTAITRKENQTLVKSHSNKIFLDPKIDYLESGNKQYIFINYTINHSSGEGKPKQYLKTCIQTYNDITDKWEPENENMRFFNLMTKNKITNQNAKINSNKMTRILRSDFNNINDYMKFREKISEGIDEIIYEKARKLYYPNIFADLRPTKKQIKNNKKAALLEEKNNLEEAIKLYEENVSEKTGSPTTYKNLCRIYKRSNDLFRIKEVCDIAIPIFIYLNDKKNTLYFLKLKFETIKDIENNMIQNGIYTREFKYYKFVTKEENDYIYENCCIDDAEEIIKEKIEDLKTIYEKDGYTCSR